jgi:hypothetical protein
MKSLDYFISEPYLMDGVGSSTSSNTLTNDDWRFKQNPADSANSNSQPAEGTADGGSGTPGADDKVDPEAAKKQFGFSVIPGKDGGVDGYDLTGQDIDGDKSNDTIRIGKDGKIDFGSSKFSDGEKAGILEHAYKDSKIDPKSVGARGDLKDVERAWSETIKKTQEKASTLRSQADAAVTESSDPNVKTESQIREEADHLDALLTKPAVAKVKEADKAKEAEAQLSTEQKELKEKFDNYDPKANTGNGGTKNGGESRALHFTDDSKNTLLDCSNKDCNPGSLVKEGERKGDYKFGQGDKATFLKGADVDAAYKASQAAKLPESKAISSTPGDEKPIPQPIDKLDQAVGAIGIEANGVKILNLNDSTNRDSGEAKNHLLDGQLNSTKNTFGTFEEGGKKYMGFFSEGFAKGDERSDVVEIDANGKPKTEGNLGAGEGWKPASAEQKAMLAKAHDARASELKKLGNGDVNAGLAKLNQIQELQGRIDNLQTWAHSEANKSGANAGGIDTTKMNSLNSAMDLLNKGDLDAANSEFKKLNADEIAKYELGQKLTELKGQGFTDAEISILKDSNSTIADINKAIDDKRDKAHALSEADKTKFADTIKDLESRVTPEQKVILDKLKGMAGKDGLDKMGKYLQTELKNLAAKVAPKPEPKKKDETRGDGDTIDFTKDAGAKAFKEDFIKSFGEGKQADGEKAFNDLFGKAESNPALKGVIEDFKSLTALDKYGKLKAGLLDALKAGDLEKIKGLQGEITKKSDEASKELADVTAKLTGVNKTASEANDAAKKALEANKDEAKKAELEKAATEAKAAFDKSTKELTKLAELKKGLEPLKNLTSKYGKTEDGKLGITGADGKVTALKQDKVEVTPQDIAKNNEELKAKIANGTAKAEEVQKYLADNKIQLTYHTAAGAKNTDGSAVCTPCENNIGVAEKLAQLAGANFNKIPYDSLSKSGAVPRLEITRPGKQNQVIEGTQGTINDYLSKLI